MDFITADISSAFLLRFFFLFQNNVITEHKVSDTACISCSVEPYSILVLRFLKYFPSI